MAEIYVPYKVQESVFALKDASQQPDIPFPFNTSDISSRTGKPPSPVNLVLDNMNCVKVIGTKRTPRFGTISVTYECNIIYDPVTDKEALAEKGLSPPGKCYSCYYNQSGNSGCNRKNQFFARKREL